MRDAPDDYGRYRGALQILAKFANQSETLRDAEIQGNWIFLRPDGIAVPDSGYHSGDMLDTETGEISGLYNNPPAGALLSVAENILKEPPAPVYLH